MTPSFGVDNVVLAISNVGGPPIQETDNAPTASSYSHPKKFSSKTLTVIFPELPIPKDEA